MNNLNDALVCRIARALEPLAWRHLDNGTDTRASPGRRERSMRLAQAIVTKVPYLYLADETKTLLEEAMRALQGVIALDEEDEGPDGESHSCAFTAARISNLLGKLRKSEQKLHDA